MKQSTGVGVLDKLDLILSSVQSGPRTLAELVADTSLSRPTVHRLAAALLSRGYLARSQSGAYTLGPRIGDLAASGRDAWLVTLATPLLTSLRDATSESAQLYRRSGAQRLCIVSVEPHTGLRDSVPGGTLLPMTAGSAAQVLAAWLPPYEQEEICDEAKFSVNDLTQVRTRGWAHSVSEREPGLASLSAPVHTATGAVELAISISGPVSRMGETLLSSHISVVRQTAQRLSEALATA